MDDRAEADFDHHDPEFHERRLEGWGELRRRCPVAYNPNHGGFWAVSGYDAVAAVARDEATFTSRFSFEPVDDLTLLGATGIPRIAGVPPAGINEAEERVHQVLRRVINPFLVPSAVADMRPLMERCATWFLDEQIERGRMDLVLDFANPVPAVATMALVGLPLAQWKHYADLFHPVGEDAAGADAYANVPVMIADLLEAANQRRRDPKGDLLTELVQLELDGKPLGDDELVSVLWNLVGGGLDTTTSLTSLTLHHLDEHPELRQALIADPSLLPTATEEFLRFFSVNETLTRTVLDDVTLCGQQMRRGDGLMLSWLSANRDETVFEDPDQVVLDRAPNPHLAFGVGSRRCIGMHLARTMFQVLATEVLTRIPDYVVDREATRFYANNPTLNGVVRMPITFTPGQRQGPLEPPF